MRSRVTTAAPAAAAIALALAACSAAGPGQAGGQHGRPAARYPGRPGRAEDGRGGPGRRR